MKSFKKSGRFKGWYFKLQAAGKTICFIPALHSGDRRPKASVQAIWNGGSFCAEYDIKNFSYCENPLKIKAGKSVFSKKGVSVCLAGGGHHISGKVEFGAFTRLKGNIMGPFRFLPFMQCRHDIISARHSLSGELTIDGQRICLDGGVGYIESDEGASFPDFYMWTQCNNFKPGKSCAITAAAAHVKLGPASFIGCFCAIIHGGKEYRLATYLGAKVIIFSKKLTVIRQGPLLLKIKLLGESPHPLVAPVNGRMERAIGESVGCVVRYSLYDRGKKLFCLTSPFASHEYVITQ